jgi:hypothetical protein
MGVQIHDFSVRRDMPSIVVMAFSRQLIRGRPNLCRRYESVDKPIPRTSLESQTSISIGAGETFDLMRWHGGQGGALGLSCQETCWLEKKNTLVAGGKENRSQTGENQKTNCEGHGKTILGRVSRLKK